MPGTIRTTRMKAFLLPGSLFALAAVFCLCACDNAAQRAMEKRARDQEAVAQSTVRQLHLKEKLDGLMLKMQTMAPGPELDAAREEVSQIVAEMAKLAPRPR